MSRFPADTRFVPGGPYVQVVSVPGPAPCVPVQFLDAMELRRVGDGWPSWSGSYRGDVYLPQNRKYAEIRFPTRTSAFYLYADPTPFTVIEVIAWNQQGPSLLSVLMEVDGPGKAQGVGFWGRAGTQIDRVSVYSEQPYAIGQFGISTCPPPVPFVPPVGPAPAVFDLGTFPPPPAIGGYALRPFPLDDRFAGPRGIDVSDVKFSEFGTIFFGDIHSLVRVGRGWGQWSHGYTGDVYWNKGEASSTIALPTSATAFVAYIQPQSFATFPITMTGVTLLGQRISTTQPVNGQGGARGFAIYAAPGDRLIEVRFEAQTDFAVGEFLISEQPSKTSEICYADCNSDGVLSAADFVCFQNRFAIQDPYAECDGNIIYDIRDLLCFQSRFVTGCR